MFENAREYIDKISQEKSIPFIDVCACKNHKVVFRYGMGKNYTGKEKFYLYSCTKPLTVALAMKLIELKKLSLDDSVRDFLPEYGNVYLQDEKGEKYSPKKEITVFDLLTMRAGLSYVLSYYPVSEWESIDSGKTKTQKVVQTFTKMPLVYEPGEKYAYSLCHDVLGAVIECAMGEDLSEVANKYLFEPLEMTNTRFGKDNDDVIDVYWDYGGEKGLQNIGKKNNFIFFDGYLSGGAGVISTVEDYIKFADALACGGLSANGKRILDRKTIEEIINPELVKESIKKNFSCAQKGDYGYGLGVRVREKPTEWGLPIGEFGWDGASGCYLMVDEENSTSIFIGMNMRGWTAKFLGEHLNIVREIYKNL